MLNFKQNLYVLQSLEYDWRKFLAWRKTHPNMKDLAQKKQLHWTLKIKVLAISWWASYLLCVVLVGWWLGWIAALILLVIFIIIAPYALPYDLVFLLWCFNPFDLLARKIIVWRARKKISKFKNLKVIGITGSYGKTSVKEFTASLLAGSFKVVKTPENNNTLIGVARTILHKLTPDTQVFVVEMGAYEPGDIAVIAELVKPSIGVITGINEQHLERFGSIDKTLDTKTELWRALPQDGVAIFNNDTRFIAELRARLPTNVPHLSYGTTDGAKIEALNIKSDEHGLNFDVRVIDRPVQWSTPILGLHQVSNILAAAAVAHTLGVSWPEIKERIAQLCPAQHRFFPIRNPNGFLVIDDTYNSNPDGAKEALKTLSTFSNSHKILITQGVVELGDKSEAIHEELGRLAGGIVTTVILVGPLVAGMAKGLRAVGFPEDQLYTVKNLPEAVSKLSEVASAGDVVLFQNDLPDVYL